MQLSEDSFRALARSSPWRWRSMHFTRRGGEDETVKAWVDRPNSLLVVDGQGRRHRERIDLAESRRTISFSVAVGEDLAASREAAQAEMARLRDQPIIWGGDVSPVVRLDGLVAHRPDDWWITYDGPIWQDYRWAAMLDPVELSDGGEGCPDGVEAPMATVVTDLREGEHQGRPAWRATVAAAAGYEPRCGCCPLLWSRISDEVEYGDAAPKDADYPIAYEVALDLQTGVVVELIPLGGANAADTIDLEIHEVG